MTACADFAVALLAAGQGVRFGGDKLLADFGGEALGLKAARTLTGISCGWNFAVCRPESDLVDQYSDMGFRVIANERSEEGQARSLHLAVEAAMQTDAKALLVALADMPFVSIAHLAALVSAYDGTIIASGDSHNSMPPVIFPRDKWDELLATSGDSGARILLKDARVVIAKPGELLDVDWPADLTASK